jgi:hypothetical protein
MPISKDCASDQIVIYQPFIYRRHSGYGWKSECLKLAFPECSGRDRLLHYQRLRWHRDCAERRNF